MWVVGAGRGPLIHRTILAATKLGLNLSDEKPDLIIVAVEKNPNAVATIQRRCEVEGWCGIVSVINNDMRNLNTTTTTTNTTTGDSGGATTSTTTTGPPPLADIMISELLGSWGDNELSPGVCSVV